MHHPETEHDYLFQARPTRGAWRGLRNAVILYLVVAVIVAGCYTLR